MRLLCSLTLCCLLAACAEQGGQSERPGVLPTIATLVADVQAMPGYFDLYWDERTGKLYVAIDELDQPFIYVSALARGVGSNDLGLDRGELGATRVVRFIRSGRKVLLIEDNLDYIAGSDDVDERRAVDESFARSVLWGFETVAADDDAVLIDATGFFLRDADHLAARLKTAEEGDYKTDAARSAIYLPRTKAFPDNSEIEAVVTFVGQPTGEILATVTPDPTAVTVHLHHSFVRLPPPGYKPLAYDPRSGYFDPSSAVAGGVTLDYAVPVGEPIGRPLTFRHRLQKTDPEAAISAAIEPIVYYVDRGAPEPIRTALMEGAAWWNEAFQAAGYEDAFRVELLPVDADPLDVRYNVIQWVHRSTRGWSYGASVRDPRTGEILKGHVSLGSLRVRQDYLLAEGLLAPYDDETVPEELLEFALARLRQLSAHEVGHTLGLEHNFAASADNRASVMDYPFPLVRLDADGDVDISHAYGVGLGAWDLRAILWGYQDFPADADAVEERQQILADTRAAGLEFIAGRHSRGDAYARYQGPVHPRSHLWDNGPDAVVELDRLMRVRQRVLAQFSERNIRLGRPMASIEDVLVPMYLLHRYQLEAASRFIGGRYFTYALRGDGQTPTRPVPAEKQREAIDALLATLTPSTLRLRPELVALIAPRPPGQPDTRELLPRQTGFIFDPLAAAATAAGLVVDQLLDATRAARMVNGHAADPRQPGFDELLGRLLDASWYATGVAPADAELQRVVNMAVLRRLIGLAADPDAQAQARAIAYDRVVELDDWAQRQVTRASEDWRAHYRFAGGQIRRFLEDPAALAPLVPLTAPPGSPIGG